VALQLLFFMTPITYPPSDAPSWARPIMEYNPLALIVNNFGRVVNDGTAPNWGWLAIATVVGGVAAMAGYAWFMKLKGAFADVV